MTAVGYTPYSPDPGYSGFSTPNKPVIIHTIVFGAVFEPTASASLRLRRSP